MNEITQDHLQDAVDSVLDRVMERLDVESRFRGQQHAENKEVLQQIHAEVRKTNGRVTRLEEQVRSIFQKLKAVATGQAGGLNLKQLIQWIAIIGGTYIVLTQVLGFHK